MRILLIGYGKMGKAIEAIAQSRVHQVVGKISKTNLAELEHINPQDVDVAIEFTEPDSAFQNIKFCLERGIPVVSGTTGWLDKREEIEQLCREKDGTFLYASNFSIGVNLFFKLNQYLAKIMNKHPQYDVRIEETHHAGKKDAPSGTAIKLAEDIIEGLDRKKKWKSQPFEERTVIGQPMEQTDLAISSVRESEVPGTHTVSYLFSEDTISIQHVAHSRMGFALGALTAAEWLGNRKGVFSMEDVLEL